MRPSLELLACLVFVMLAPRYFHGSRACREYVALLVHLLKQAMLFSCLSGPSCRSPVCLIEKASYLPHSCSSRRLKPCALVIGMGYTQIRALESRSCDGCSSRVRYPELVPAVFAPVADVVVLARARRISSCRCSSVDNNLLNIIVVSWCSSQYCPWIIAPRSTFVRYLLALVFEIACTRVLELVRCSPRVLEFGAAALTLVSRARQAWS